MFHVEFDDGRPIEQKEGRSKFCTAKGRSLGMHVVFPDGSERPLNIGFMRVSEMKHLENLLNEIENARCDKTEALMIVKAKDPFW